MSDTGKALRAELIDRFRDPRLELDDGAFNELALRVFTHNYAAVPPYRIYCRSRGRTPDSVAHWSAIPAVPTGAFKELTLLARGRTAERVFLTSGTSRGEARRGAHHVADLDLYRAALRPAFRSFLLPDDARPRFLSLMPPASLLPDSSLAFMISDLVGTFGSEGSGAFATPDAIDYAALERAMETAERAAEPVLLIGTSASFIHWLDRLEERGRTFQLPHGSRLMDTGGYKGKGRVVPEDTLRWRYREHFGIPMHCCINEYGMTELLSQRYDTTLRDRHAGRTVGREREGRPKGGPPWLRSVAVDPESLEPLPPGERGVVRHLDLANVDSVAAIQTEDLGRVDEEGRLVLLGRIRGAPQRGCSAALDELLEERS